jgi:hypothetical protein
MGLPGFVAEKSLYNAKYSRNMSTTGSFDSIEKILPQARKWVSEPYEYNYCHCRDWEDDEEMTCGSNCYCW